MTTCSTCGGSGEVVIHGISHVVVRREPCPDCNGTGTATDAPGPCMHSLMGHMCKAHGGPKDTCDCYPAPQAPDALAAKLEHIAAGVGLVDHQRKYLREAVAMLTALAAVVEAARAYVAQRRRKAEHRSPDGMLRTLRQLEAALAELDGVK